LEKPQIDSNHKCMCIKIGTHFKLIIINEGENNDYLVLFIILINEKN
jgi:hypothetical protein